MDRDFFKALSEPLDSEKRQRLGLDKLTPEKLFHGVRTFISLMPDEAMKALAQKWAASPSKLDQWHAGELRILLFAQQEIKDLLLKMPPEMARELVLESIIRPNRPPP